jgi:hypothetical protein
MSVLLKLREKFGKHSLKLAMYKKMAGASVDQGTVTEVLRTCLPKAKFSDKTWTTYSNRLSNLFTHTGYFVRVGSQIVVQDLGAPIADRESYARKGKKRGVVFSAPASPATVCDALEAIESVNKLKVAISNGYRNSLTVLKRFELISIDEDIISINVPSIKKYGGYKEAVWTSAKNEPVIGKCIEKLNNEPSLSGYSLGEFVSKEYNNKWTKSSMQRNGNSLKQWSSWVKEGIATSVVPMPPGRIKQ